MDTQCVASTSPEYDNNHFITAATSGCRDGEKMEEEEMEEGKEGQLNKHESERCSTPTQNTPLAHLTQPQSSEVAQWTCHSEGETCKKKKKNNNTIGTLLSYIECNVFLHFNFFMGRAQKWSKFTNCKSVTQEKR